MEDTPTAALIVVGNEVLSGKVSDENGPWAARRLRVLGVDLIAIRTVRDRVDEVSAAVKELRGADWVFTSGGVGPTHDDITVRAVAVALGREVIRLGPLADAIRALHRHHHDGAEPPEAALRMADVPQGTRLLGDSGYPTLAVENVIMLPGVPQFFRYQLERIAPLLAAPPFRLACVYLAAGEGEVAVTMTELILRQLGATPEQIDRERERSRAELSNDAVALEPFPQLHGDPTLKGD